VFGDCLYAATDNETTGGEVWRTDNGTTWNQVNADGFGNANNTRVVSLETFGGQLYASTQNSTDGGAVWRTANGTDWEWVVNDGFGDVNNIDIASLVAFDGDLYAVVGNFDTGAEVWHSSTGDRGSWKLVVDTGFGTGRGAVVGWDNVTAVYENSLYVGTFTFGSGGGRVWQMLRQVYLPLVVRNF
jgi:hypothetical protein